MPLLSICCISYNHEKYISKTIDSFLMQNTNFKYEIVIADDCSTDDTQLIIKKYYNEYNELINAVLRKENLGMVENWSNAISLCSGKYISFCEGDDYWTDPLKLQKQVDFLEANTKYGMVSSDIFLVDSEGNNLSDNNMVLKQRKYRRPEVDFYDLLHCNTVNTLTTCIRADIIKSLAERVQRENLWFVHDYWFWLNIAINHKVKISYDKTAAYRIHQNGVSTQKGFLYSRSALVKYDAVLEFLKKNPKLLLTKNNVDILALSLGDIIAAHSIKYKQKQKLLSLLFSNYLLFVKVIKRLCIVYAVRNYKKIKKTD